MENLTTTTQRLRRLRERAALDRAIDHMGGLAALAAAIDPDLTYQAVQTWYKKRVPYPRCRAIERVTQGLIQCEQLREDYAGEHERPYRRAA